MSKWVGEEVEDLKRVSAEDLENYREEMMNDDIDCGVSLEVGDILMEKITGKKRAPRVEDTRIKEMKESWAQIVKESDERKELERLESIAAEIDEEDKFEGMKIEELKDGSDWTI